MYHLIWSVTVESCMSPAKYLSIAAKITAPMDKEYKHNEELAEFPGWKIVRGYDKENANYTFLLTIKNKSKVNYNKITAKVSIKDLKSHYTEAKLVQLLEEKGIGRPSTFSSLIEKIQERGYVKKDNVTGKKIKCVDYELEKDELQEIEDEREFGNEKNKLVIQPLGVLVLEFLLQHFDKLFDYEYTKNMEANLDSISKGDKIWHELCKECSDDIDDCSKDLKTVDKKVINIDDTHVFMIGKYGPVIKKQEGEKTIFINCRKDLDMDKLEKGEYELEDLIEKQNTKKIVGKYKKDDVVLKKGKFGNYIEWGTNKKSLNGIKKEIEDITMEDLIPIIENKVTLNTSIVREINNEISIRNGKYGHYIYYKTKKMTKPKFIKLGGFKGDYNTCPKEQIEDYVSKN
jgi:DNA topoisomerase-1